MNTQRRIVPTQTYHRTHEEILKLLTLANAHSAMRGKPCPVAAAVVDRLLSVGV